jgi:hypothetical protein
LRDRRAELHWEAARPRFGNARERCETAFELPSDHRIHVEHETDRLPDEGA